MKLNKFLSVIHSVFLQVLPAAILGIGLLATFALDNNQRQMSLIALDREFKVKSEDIFQRINERLDDYGRVLRGGVGLFAASPAVGRQDWRKFVSSLNFGEDIPGMQGIGFSPIVKSGEKSAHVDGVRREGFPNYRINPDGERDLYTPVLYIEPFSGRNLRAFGYDMYSDPTRRLAMDSARDEDHISISGKVTLVQETETDIQAGFLMYAPVYANNALHDTVEARRNNIKGWIYAPFRMNDVMAGIVGGGFKLNGLYLDVIICDGSDIKPESVLYHYDNDIDSVITGGKPPLLLFKRTLTFGGRSWTVTVHTPQIFDTQYFDGRSLLIEVFGSVVSLLTAVISWLLMSNTAGRWNRRRTDAEDRRSGKTGWTLLVAPYGLAMAMSLAAGFVMVKTDESEQQAWSRAERTEVEHQLDIIRLRLERVLTVPMMRTRGMEAQIRAHGGVGTEDFKKVAQVLLRGHPVIRNMSVSHGTTVDLMYPLAGNESVVGVDLKNVKSHWPTTRRAIETQTTVVHGPVPLIQGGSGLIVRTPVFLPDPGGGESRLFGLISIVLDMPTIYAEAGLDREDLPIRVAIRGQDGLGEKGEMIRGDASVFSGHPVEMDVEFPNGSWRLAAMPRNGWGSAAQSLSLSRLLSVGLFLVIVLISFGAASHVIDRRRMLVQVRSSEERFRHLLSIASDGVHILDGDGNLVMWSNSFLRMLGYSEAEAATLNVADWDAATPRDLLSPLIRTRMKIPAVFETRHRRRDGSEFDAEINASGIELGGRAYLYASARDVSERKAHDEELCKARLDAENAAKAKSDFLAMMSHEIRTPITSVLGVSDLLRQTPLSPEQDGYVKTLRSSTRTLLTILNDILDISKIEAGKVLIEAATFDLHEAVREVVDLGKGSASKKGLAVDLTISEEVPAIVTGDSTRVRQILFNLMSNAIKFTEQGSVIVRLRVQDKSDHGATVIFEVADTGIGITRDQMEHLFTAFCQADQTTTRRFGGTGLGLAIAKKLVELMGGDIGVQSQPGDGATFWFSLPFDFGDAAVLAAPDSPAIPPAPARPQRPLSILLAEDNRINQMLVRSMLQKFGHSVRVAENGRQALDAVIAEDFDAVLMDMQMPEMDGEEATRRIRALPPPKNRVPVLALTADVMLEHRERYLRAGVDELVAKPIDWLVLSEALAVHTAPAAGDAPAPGAPP